MTCTRFLVLTLAATVALAIGSQYAVADGYGPIAGHTQTIEHLTAPDGGLERAAGNGRGGARTDDMGPVAQTTGCVEMVCPLAGNPDAGVATLNVTTGMRYELTVGTAGAVRLLNGAACTSYATGTGKRVNEGASRYWTAPVGTGPDGGVAKYTCCGEVATSWAQMCPAP